MWEYHAHRTAVEDSLHEAIATLVWDSDERGDACEQPSNGQLAYIVNGQRRVLQIDEKRIKTGIFC